MRMSKTPCSHALHCRRFSMLKDFDVRYALYFTPPADDPLAMAAATWLGRDAFLDGNVAMPVVDGFAPEDMKALTEDPRRYGFHATIKAPFTLAEGRSESELLQALDEFSAECEAFDIPRIKIGQLGPFFALVPAELCEPLQAFAGETVRRFEPFRAPLSPEDIARRKPDKLSLAQRDNLKNWGYPYVFDEFRFHMTLTGPVPSAQQPAMQKALDEAFAGFVDKPLSITTLALFVEPRRGAPFKVHSLMPLGGTSTRKIA
jgi:putative phosphonate metabolism protein